MKWVEFIKCNDWKFQEWYKEHVKAASNQSHSNYADHLLILVIIAI